MIKAFFFDIGNVLLTFDYEFVLHRFQQRSPLPAAQIRAVIEPFIPQLEMGAITTEAFLEQASAALAYAGSAEEFAAEYCDIFQVNQPMWDLAARLHRDNPLYLFSNTSELHWGYCQERYPQFSLFDGGIFSMRIGAMKPSHAFYAAGQALAGVEPEEIFYIDDLAANVAAASSLGWQTHLYRVEQHERLLEQLAGE